MIADIPTSDMGGWEMFAFLSCFALHLAAQLLDAHSESESAGALFAGGSSQKKNSTNFHLVTN